MPDLSLLTHAAAIVSAYVTNNAVLSGDLPDLIQTVYRTLAGLGTPNVVEHAPQQPAVPIKKSVFPDYMVCLEDGKKLKMLKRHLAASYGMTPDDYRKKWGLPHDYPMVAPDYAAHRSSLAKKIGLGRRNTDEPVVQIIPEGKRMKRKSKIAA